MTEAKTAILQEYPDSTAHFGTDRKPRYQWR